MSETVHGFTAETVHDSHSKGLPDAIPLGTIVRRIEGHERLSLTSDDPKIVPHLDSVWLDAFVRERLEIKPEDPVKDKQDKADAKAASGDSAVPFSMLQRHAVLFGGSGSGKTRLALHLISEQLQRGCSVVAMDPKPDTIEHLLACAQAAGITARQITLLAPQESERGVPGWNPLDYVYAQLPIAQIVGDFVSILEQSATSWGPRLREVLVNGLTIIASQRLTLFELVRFLQREDYRLGLLREVEEAGYKGYSSFDALTVREAVEYFTHEVAGWTKSERASAIAPVLNKVRELLRVPFLRAMLGTRQSELDFSRLWQQQELVFVHLDRTALGDEGLKLLGGLLVWQLYRTAMRVEGKTPVLLSLDELGVGEQFIGKAATEILAIARSRNLRVLVACQHLEQLTDELRSSLLTNTAFRAFFRLGVADARVIASSLAAGTGETLARIDLEPGKGDLIVEIPHPVVDGHGQPLRLSEDAWIAFQKYLSENYQHGAVVALNTLAALSGVRRLYVLPPGGAPPVEMGKYLKSLDPYPALNAWDSGKGNVAIGFVVRGPAPLTMGIRFPRFKLTVTSKRTETERQQQWIRLLLDLPVQHAVAWTGDASPPIVKVLPVPDANQNPAALAGFTSAILSRFAGQKDLDATEEYRRGEVVRVALGKPPVPHTESRPAKASPEAEEAESAVGAKTRKPLPHSQLVEGVGVEEAGAAVVVGDALPEPKEKADTTGTLPLEFADDGSIV